MEAAGKQVLRMILGEFRREGGHSDKTVREKLGVCSFDVLVRRHRLLYASSVAREAPHLLHALHEHVGGVRIPWTKATVDDVAALKRAASKKLEELPLFEADPQKWVDLWTRFPRQWAQIVKMLPPNDCYDEVGELPAALVIWKRRLAPQLVDGCRSDFRTRLRLIHHLEYSSPKCLEVLVGEVPPLPSERARELAAIDASASQSQEGWCQFSGCWCPLHPSTVVQILHSDCMFEILRFCGGKFSLQLLFAPVHVSSAELALAVRNQNQSLSSSHWRLSGFCSANIAQKSHQTTNESEL